MQTRSPFEMCAPSPDPASPILPSMLSVKGHSHRCERIINMKEHALIGISPFNPQFSPSYVSALLAWAESNFKKIDILIPDVESAALLLTSTGTSAQKAIRKARKELNRQRRVIEPLIDKDSPATAQLIEFSDHFENTAYKKLRKMAQNEYDEHEEFRTACDAMSDCAIASRVRATTTPSTSPLPKPRGVATENYILTEIPFYLNTPVILDVRSSTLIYHRKWPIGDQLFNNRFRIAIDRNQGHGIVSISNQKPKI
ncbi:tRNA-dependent cyclodipeptide synthase [Stenotrophomonas sp. NPDC077659]|uniref:tRNA-dependent cyclodipeptide synthase n=1 Tax=Stenotrophomonas sp. NPDC077659 TaxID=3390694 RepID=UPI003D0738D2